MTPEVEIKLRLKLPLLWLALVLLGAVLVPNPLWNMLLLGLGGLFAASFYWARQMSQGLRAERRLRYGWVAVGDRLRETFTITNKSTLPAVWVEVRDASNVPGYQAGIVQSVNARRVRWHRDAICRRRGQFHLGPWSLYTTDPFGIFAVEIRYPVADEITIHPPTTAAVDLTLPAGQSAGQARARDKALQATNNAASVRAYQPADPMRWIHWRTSARRGDLMVREFDLDAAGDVWFVLDLDAAVQLAGTADAAGATAVWQTAEQAILLTASLAARALAQNRAVGLAAYGRQPQLLPPGRGMRQQWAILRALALVQADGDVPFAAGLRDIGRQMQRGAAAVLVTASPDPDWLPSLLQLTGQGVQCHAVLLDRPSFGGTGNALALRDLVRGVGAGASIVRQGDVQAILPDADERRGFWGFRTTATGRVIVTQRPDEARRGA